MSSETIFPAHQNLATKTKWIAEIPFSLLFSDISSSINLNITRFTLPSLNMETPEASYLSYDVPVPSRIQNIDSKEVEFEYILSSDYNQYFLMCRWLNACVANEFLENENLTLKQKELAVKLPINLFLLSEFKTNVYKIKFNNCFINSLESMDFIYNTSDDEVLKHVFRCSFSNITFEKHVCLED